MLGGHFLQRGRKVGATKLGPCVVTLLLLALGPPEPTHGDGGNDQDAQQDVLPPCLEPMHEIVIDAPLAEVGLLHGL